MNWRILVVRSRTEAKVPRRMAGGDLECREQRGGAVADVVVAALLGVAGLHRQRLLGPVQRLDLRLILSLNWLGSLPELARYS
jgi:hypothetical protein